MKNTNIIILFLLITNCYSQTNKLDIFYNNIQKQFSKHKVVKKNVYITNEYYDNYIGYLSEKIKEQIKYSNPKSIAFDIIIDGDINRVNLITFDIKKNNFQSIGQFNTKALITYYFIVKENKGYLLLLNKFVTKENVFTNKIISILNKVIEE